ncbi:MAG: RNA polymerase sigma-54 factor, partial [Paludibacteraceae bacterium]|nr:RNA polymerase sigma-54 factor [Paludibacteraceae bacterium]
GEPVVTLNDSEIPPLRISKTYKEMFEDYSRNKEQNKEMKDAVMFVKQKIDSAKLFIDALKQRNNTMFLVMSTIVKLQKEFFLKGDENCLRPLILKDVAEITGLDISTISRVSNSKYIQTEFGLYPLKYFFSESMQKENGEEVSSRAIKSILKECIDNEDKNNPIKDEALMEILKEKGFIIARRTVAKYREQLGIPVARLRKEI